MQHYAMNWANLTSLCRVLKFAIVQIFGNMAHVKQYKHFLFIETSSDAVQDEFGNWVGNGGISRKFISMCREESNGGGTEIQVAGGEYQISSSVIQCPVTCPFVPKGTKVIVANDVDCKDVRIEGVCLNCDPAQLHTRIWV